MDTARLVAALKDIGRLAGSVADPEEFRKVARQIVGNALFPETSSTGSEYATYAPGDSPAAECVRAVTQPSRTIHLAIGDLEIIAPRKPQKDAFRFNCPQCERGVTVKEVKYPNGSAFYCTSCGSETEQQEVGHTPTAIAGHNSRVLVDGKPFPVRSIVVKADMRSAWTAEMEFFPFTVAKERGVDMPREIHPPTPDAVVSPQEQ